MPIAFDAAALEAALPPLEGRLRLPGLGAEVTILRDAQGVPHLRAKDSADAFFAQGFVHAQDRLFQMELNRRRAVGRAAEWLGAPAAEGDVLARRLGIEAASRRDAAVLGAEARTMLERYVAGVNAFITTGPAPIEYTLLQATPEKWEPWHCIAVMRRLGLLMGSVWFKLWRAAALPIVGIEAAMTLRYDDGGADALIVPQGVDAKRWEADLAALAPAIAALMEGAAPDVSGGGSNNWAIAPHLSATGRPLLAGDPHRVFEIPNMYAQGHVACDAFDVVGLTVPGVPGFPHFAHNGTVAWCVTHTFADIHDVFIERFSDAGAKYEFGGERRATTRRTDTIAVRGGASRTFEIVETHHGPVIAGDPASGRALTLRSVQFAETDLSFDCLPRMLRADGVPALYEATRGWGLIDHNLVAGDTAGRIGFLLRARVPKRGRENGWLPVPGWTGEHEWRGWIAHEDMPRLLDPPGGVIVTANNRVVADDHPDYICTDCHPPHRAKRIAELLRDPAHRSVEGAPRIHGDTLSVPAQELVAALKAVSPTRESAALHGRLTAWDGRMSTDSSAAADYMALRRHLVALFAERSGLGALAGTPLVSVAPGIVSRNQLWLNLPALLRANDTRLLKGWTWTRMLEEALRRTAAEPAAAPWGEAHRPRLAHPLSSLFPEHAALLDPPSRAIGGDNECVWANGMLAASGPAATYGALARYAFDVGAWDNSRWTVFHGAAGQPGSPHFADQNDAWSECRMVPMRYSWDVIAAEATATQTLSP